MIGVSGNREAFSYTIPSRLGTNMSSSPCVKNGLDDMAHHDGG